MELREAVASDADALADLLFRSPQAGRMVLGQDRTPDPFARRRPYPDARTVVAIDDGRLVGTGTVARKRVLLAGREVTAAYVFDVAVDEGARGRGIASRVLADLEAWASDAAVLYAHVLRGNEASVRTFTANGYRVARDLASRAYPVFGSRTDPPTAGSLDPDATATLLREGLDGYDLVRPLDGPALRELWTSLPGYRPEDVWTTGDAVLGLWDYSSILRSVPLRLPPEVRALDALGRLASVFRVPFPRAPRLGEPLRYGLLLGGAGDPGTLGRLLSAALGRARDHGLDVIVFFHDARRRPSWTKAAFSIADTYHLVAKGDEALGRRPVWVDPIDL